MIRPFTRELRTLKACSLKPYPKPHFRDTANSLLSTADEAARQNAGQSAELVKEVTSHKRLVAELEADLHAERARRGATEATSAQLQAR